MSVVWKCRIVEVKIRSRSSRPLLSSPLPFHFSHLSFPPFLLPDFSFLNPLLFLLLVLVLPSLFLALLIPSILFFFDSHLQLSIFIILLLNIKCPGCENCRVSVNLYGRPFWHIFNTNSGEYAADPFCLFARLCWRRCDSLLLKLDDKSKINEIYPCATISYHKCKQ